MIQIFISLAEWGLQPRSSRLIASVGYAEERSASYGLDYITKYIKNNRLEVLLKVSRDIVQN